MIGFKVKNKRKKGSFITFLVIMAVIVAVLYNWNYRIQTEEFELQFVNLPESFDGYRIAVVSDLHAAKFGEANADLIAAVRDTKPDMIALTGDVTDAVKQVPFVLETVRQLVEVAPVYYVAGNHEYKKNGGAKELFAALPELGVTVMRNDILSLEHGGDSIWLVGLDDVNGPYDMESRESVFARLGDGFSLTLVHRNGYLAELAGYGTDLVICGHAHGGLIRLPGTDGLFDHNLTLFPTHTSGDYTEGNTTMLVSRGLGNHTGIPRIMNPPHLPVVILKREA